MGRVDFSARLWLLRSGLSADPAAFPKQVYVLVWVKRRVARQAGVIVAASVALSALLVLALGESGVIDPVPAFTFARGALLVVPAAGLVAGWIAKRLLGARLAHLVEVIDGAGPHDDLARIRDLGHDEVGAIGSAVNRLLARLTSIRASMIDQERELSRAQRELELTANLAAKTDELKKRLEERAVLFEILRLTTSSPELDEVLHRLVERVGQLLELRECAIFIFDEDAQRFVVRATFGFESEELVVGRAVELGEGISGLVAATREPVVLDDVSRDARYLAFWGHAKREGSLGAVPILHQQRLLGVLTCTRDREAPITDMQLNLLCAIADNTALAIRNAQLFERMRELSTHDELTGLANRRLFRHQLGQEIDRARRFQKPLSLVAIDIDHFKQLNDRNGHPTGDAALRSVAALLESRVRKVDTVARVGGEEFMLLLPRADASEAALVAEKLREAVASSLLPGSSEQPEGRLTVSLGVAELGSADDEAGESLVARADRALYAAKHAGRNRVCTL